MADTTIEWTDKSWNPVRGCDRVSPGCVNCYAEHQAMRIVRMDRGLGMSEGEGKYDGLVRMTSQGPKWTGVLRTVPDKVDEPLHWKTPSRIFVNSMSDLFHEDVPDAFIDQVFGTMVLAKQHTFQILTKRPQRMRDYLLAPRLSDYRRLRGETTLQPRGVPPPNIWLGVSVEDQAAADERIPLLLQTPAAVRWISAEPLLGPIDLRGWGHQAPSPGWSTGPSTWSEFAWPEWVPPKARQHIEEFWGAAHGRGPRDWLRDHVIQHVPATGARVTFDVVDGIATANKMATGGVPGRYLHCWNNVGHLVTDDGKTLLATGGSGSGWLNRWLTPQGDYQPRLNWVVAGGESGPKARPSHPDWYRTLRDQCQAAGVPFFFKQWGNWAPFTYVDKATGHVLLKLTPERGREVLMGGPAEGTRPLNMRRMHKSAAGRELDGREWNEYPA